MNNPKTIIDPGTNEHKTIKQLANELGAHVSTIYYRMGKDLTPEQVASHQKRHRAGREPKYFTHPDTGERKTARQWAEAAEVCTDTIRRRTSTMPIRDALNIGKLKSKMESSNSDFNPHKFHWPAPEKLNNG